MITKRHFHLLEAISVLMFAVLANYIFGLDIDFSERIDWISLVRLLSLTISSFIFYLTIYRLQDLYAEAEKDDNSETDIEVKAKNPVGKRYKEKFENEKLLILKKMAISIFLIALFFLINPIWELIFKQS